LVSSKVLLPLLFSVQNLLSIPLSFFPIAPLHLPELLQVTDYSYNLLYHEILSGALAGPQMVNELKLYVAFARKRLFGK